VRGAAVAVSENCGLPNIDGEAGVLGVLGDIPGEQGEGEIVLDLRPVFATEGIGKRVGRLMFLRATKPLAGDDPLAACGIGGSGGEEAGSFCS